MEVMFWGATEDVTGSMTYVKLPEGYILIDCGMAQGLQSTEQLNDIPFPVDPKDLKAVVLTHAHLDHSGFLPRLVKKGFKGTIYCTKPTAALARIILMDSASLEDQGYYDEDDVTHTTRLIKTIEWGQTMAVAGGSISLMPAGHILGASSVRIKSENKSMVFSGDLGRKNDPLIPEPGRCPKADAVVMESTYGGKVRTGHIEKELHSFLMTLSRESRVGIIASFAVARGQMLMALINDFFDRHPEDKFKVVYDSPMMNEANHVYENFADMTKLPYMARDTQKHIEMLQHVGQWDSLKKKKGPLLVISSSGMLTGGRIHRHLMNWQDDPKAILFLPGYQGQGTPGRMMLEGQRRIQFSPEEEFNWQGEVIGSEAFSSHADQSELLDWVADLDQGTHIYLNHGELPAKRDLKKILDDRGFKVTIPVRGQKITV